MYVVCVCDVCVVFVTCACSVVCVLCAWWCLVCCVCWCVCVCVLVCAVVYVLRVCVLDVRFVFWCCVVLCCVVMCGVGAGVGVCVWCVCGAAWHAEKHAVCRFKTSPCVGSKRLRVYRQNARMCSTCARFASTHGSVLNVHTETFSTNTRRRGKGREVERGGFLLSLSLFPSLFLSCRSCRLSLLSQQQ